MIDYIKQHIYLFIGIIAAAIIVILFIALYRQSNNNLTSTVINEAQLSETILVDESITDSEKGAATTALDNVFSYSNYGETTQFLYGLLDKSTDNFKPKIKELISVLEKDSSRKMFSRLAIDSADYSVKLNYENDEQIAIVTLKGEFTTDSVPTKKVLVVQRLVYQEPYWLLDGYQIIDQ